jgi:hypothetical protein
MSRMRGPFVITAPFATPEDVARSYGIPKRRANELRKMIEDSLTKKGYVFPDREDSKTSKNGASSKAAGSHRMKVKVRANTKADAKSGKASRRKTTRAKAKTSR